MKRWKWSCCVCRSPSKLGYPSNRHICALTDHDPDIHRGKLHMKEFSIMRVKEIGSNSKRIALLDRAIPISVYITLLLGILAHHPCQWVCERSQSTKTIFESTLVFCWAKMHYFPLLIKQSQALYCAVAEFSLQKIRGFTRDQRSTCEKFP